MWFSDSSSLAVLPMTVDKAMQLMQGMIRNVGLNLSKVVDGPQQVPQEAVQNTMYTSIADLIMQSRPML